MLIGWLQDDNLLATRDVEIGGSQREGCGVEVGAVAENDDGEAVGGEAQAVGVKSHGVAVMPHALMPPIRIEEPAEALSHWPTLPPAPISRPLPFPPPRPIP